MEEGEHDTGEFCFRPAELRVRERDRETGRVQEYTLPLSAAEIEALGRHITID
jgi:hypothetical protein